MLGEDRMVGGRSGSFRYFVNVRGFCYVVMGVEEMERWAELRYICRVLIEFSNGWICGRRIC